jgi:hypothetical protein
MPSGRPFPLNFQAAVIFTAIMARENGRVKTPSGLSKDNEPANRCFWPNRMTSISDILGGAKKQAPITSGSLATKVPV